MKKNIIFASFVVGALVTALSCSNKKVDGPNPDADSTAMKADEKAQAGNMNPWPWDFPKDVEVDVHEGQIVLAATYYPEYLKEGAELDKKTYIFYKGDVVSKGAGSTKIEHVGKETEIPNALIIPIPSAATAKVGDIVLTWWQSGSGLQRAIVTDASDPKAPVVSYLDLSWTEKDGKLKKFAKDEKLKPGTFKVLNDGEWAPGMQIAFEENGRKCIGRIISLTDEKVLISGFAGSIYTANRTDCQLISLKPSFKPGDNVFGKVTSTYEDNFTVVKYDKKNGRVWVTDNHKSTSIKSILEVASKL